MRRLRLILLVLVTALGACGRGGSGDGGEARKPATARFRITNEGDQPVPPALVDSNTSGEGYADTYSTFSGVELLSPQRRLVSFPMYDKQRSSACLCTTVTDWKDWSSPSALRRGGPAAFAYAVYWVPPGVSSVQVASRPLGDISAPLPISAPDPAAPTVADEPGPQLIATATRRTFELDRVVEGTTRRETDQGNKVQIALSTDVLFAFDKADLTAAAQAELRRVAGRLAEAKGTVRVVGHTDDVGSDSYNLGLSQRRAQAVHQALARMVAAGRMRFQVQGKGETEPVVQGTSAQARRRNRRVEISFERVLQPPPTTTPPTTQPAQPAAVQPLGSAQGTGEFAGSRWRSWGRAVSAPTWRR
jgi:outer membrane protein OmpA-like peptidoglycan-associated protein